MAVAAVQLELPEDVLNELADRVAQRVLANLASTHDDDRWLTSAEAARHIGRSLDALHKLSAAREISVHQREPNGRLYFRRSELDDWMAG